MAGGGISYDFHDKVLEMDGSYFNMQAVGPLT